MSTRTTVSSRSGQKRVGSKTGSVKAGSTTPRSVAIADAGIRTAPQFASLMSALIADIATDRISPKVGNAMVNAGGKLLKVAEMQRQYGKTSENGIVQPLLLA